MLFRRIVSMLAALALLLTCCACAATPETASVGASAGKGRYMEEKITLPLPEGETDQSLIGMCEGETGMEYFVMCVSGDESGYKVSYYRHSVSEDGSISTKSEPWLYECSPQGGNELRVEKDRNGTMYFAFSDYDENGASRQYMFVSRDDGKTGAALNGNAASVCGMITSMAFSDGGRIVVADMDGGAFVLDAEGNIEKELDAGAYNSNIAACGNRVAMLAPSGPSVRIYDVDTGESENFDIDAAEKGMVAMCFAEDGTLYLADSEGLFSHTKDGTIWENFVDGDVTNLGIPGYYISRMAVVSGERNVIYVSDFEANIYRYAYDPNAAQTASIELNVFSLRENNIVRQAVVTFNRMRSDVKVSYTVASELTGGGTDADYIKALNTELLAADGPDVIILDGLPLDSYIEKNVLEDISTAVDGADAMLRNARAAYERDGKLYAVPLGIGLCAVLAKDDAACFDTLGALADAAEAAGESVLSPIGYSYETLPKMLLTNYGSELYAGGDAAVRAFLTDAKRVSDGIGSTDALGEGMALFADWPEEEVRDMLMDNQFYPQLYAFVMGTARNAVLQINTLADSDCMIAASAAEQYGGTISSIDGKFYAKGLAGINRASENIETAEDFLRVLLSYDVQSMSDLYGSFPVNSAALDSLFARGKGTFGTSFVLDGNSEITGEWPSKPMLAQIRAIIDAVDTPVIENDELYAMLLPEITAYLDGSETLDGAAEKITSVLSTYLSE